MNSILKTIQEGFLRRIGAHLEIVLAAWLLGQAGWAIRLSLPNTQVSPTERIFYAATIVVLIVAWLVYHRRIRAELSYLRSGLLIHSARYGAGDSVDDVAPFLRRQIGLGRRKIPVGNNLLEGRKDPCEGIPKELIVVLSRMGQQERLSPIPEIPPPQPPKYLEL